VNFFALLLYLLCVLTSMAVTFFLVRSYLERKTRLLLWSSLCFVGLTINNIILLLDLGIWPDINLRPLRLGVALAGMLLLLYGFIWEAE